MADEYQFSACHTKHETKFVMWMDIILYMYLIILLLQKFDQILL